MVGPIRSPGQRAGGGLRGSAVLSLVARLEILVHAYGRDDRVTSDAVLAALPNRIRAGIALHHERAEVGDPGFVRMVAAGSLGRRGADLDWFETEIACY